MVALESLIPQEKDGARVLGELIAAVHEGEGKEADWAFVDEKLPEAVQYQEVMLWARGALGSEQSNIRDLALSMWGISDIRPDEETLAMFRSMMKDGYETDAVHLRAACALAHHGDTAADVRAALRDAAENGDPDIAAAARATLDSLQ